MRRRLQRLFSRSTDSHAMVSVKTDVASKLHGIIEAAIAHIGCQVGVTDARKVV